jgi:tetratricopeptide (TPR) repeat protein
VHARRADHRRGNAIADVARAGTARGRTILFIGSANFIDGERRGIHPAMGRLRCGECDRLSEVVSPRAPAPLIAAWVAVLLLIAPQIARAEGDAAPPPSAAVELTRQGREHAASGDDALAMRRFVDAVRLDPSYGPAYLELGAARERAGDWAEAERTYDVAIEHVPHFIAAFRARAALLRKMGQFAREMADLEHLTHLAEGPDTLRALAARYIEDKAWPAALATFRKLRALAEREGDEELVREATVQVRGLAVLCAELDPVVAGAANRDWARRAISSVARRKGM